MMNKTVTNMIAITVITCMISACGKPGNDFFKAEQHATIHPSYTGTVIPYNIAPMNFMIYEEGSRFTVRFAVAGKDSFDISCKNGKVLIPLRQWKNLLRAHLGEQMEVSIFVKKASGWVCYMPIRFTIAADPVDSWLAYRLIEPGYETWNTMGIYQRCLENFIETPVLVNQLTDRSCMNCHSFCKNDPQKMLFHIRQQHAGTLFLMDGKVRKINTKTPLMLSAGVYPRWHPEGRYVAFSVNTTRQEFHTAHNNKVEVYDLDSDIVIYDTETNTIFTDSLISSKSNFETFPEWSPDGQYLYFCSAPECPMPQQYDSLRYDLLRIAFDPSTGNFENRTETLVSSAHTGKSVALPRVSPEGKQVVFCMSDYGTFPIWHSETDLYLLNMETKAIRNLENINSNQSDSYHSWSTNGRWMVFSSRRIDGTFTRPYLCYFDLKGNVHTPFILPQKDPMHYDFSLKSYNVPEFITDRVPVSPYEFSKIAKGKALDVKMN